MPTRIKLDIPNSTNSKFQKGEVAKMPNSKLLCVGVYRILLCADLPKIIASLERIKRMSIPDMQWQIQENKLTIVAPEWTIDLLAQLDQLHEGELKEVEYTP